MNKGKNVILLLPSVLWILILIPGRAGAGDDVRTHEARTCLECHAGKGIVKKFDNNESIRLYVDAGKLGASVHNFLTCSDCHAEFSIGRHPSRRFRSRKQYKIRSSLICRRCHLDGRIASKPIHAGLLLEERYGRSPVCTDCHGSHSVMPIAGGEIFESEKRYCMSCHGFDINMGFKNGEKVSVKIDASVIAASVHNMLTCSDCHYGFSSEEHPQRNFGMRRAYMIFSSESCRRCHFDKYTKTLESIHYAVLRQGNLKAPVCTDCHGSHLIVHTGEERALTAKRCRKCHPEIYKVYSKSVHGTALFTGINRDVPVCIDCHTAHDIVNPTTLEYHEKIPEMCSGCHANRKIMGKYGLSTNVVKTYLADFHGVTLSFYKKQRERSYKPTRPIAVCNDCHGTHNITGAGETSVPEVKSNLLKRCRKCHKDVTGNFPDAWLSHYEPSLAKAPLVFIVNVLYKTFIPIMAAGLILQVLLHLWRYSFNR